MPLERDAIAWIVKHLAHLRAEFGDVLGDPDLVEPNATYFPDEFSVTPEAIAQLARRMATYAPLSEELPIAVAFVEDEDAGGNTQGGGCGSGACSPGGEKNLARACAAETDDGYALLLDVAAVNESALLTSAIARGLGRIVQYEAGEEVAARDEGPLAELTAVACGFGVLLLNGSCVYKKGCGGMRRHRGTFLETDELAMAVALFVRATGKKASLVRRHLPPTQREAFDEAWAWLEDRPNLVRALASAPETLVDGHFPAESKRGFFAKLLSRESGRSDDAPLEGLSIRKTPRSEEELRRLTEAKALVDEALQEG